MSDERASGIAPTLRTLTSNDPLWAARGKAIDAYSRLEHALCRVMQHMLDISSRKAGFIFFKITSANARSAIIEKLIQDKCGSRFNLFWNSFFKQLKPIDLERNEIVHWTSLYDYGERKMLLCPPSFWTINSNSPSKNVKNLEEFTAKCEVYANLAHNFATALSITASTLYTSEMLESLLQIFQRPIVYPLPAGHPLDPHV